jgi:hypothetical protein
VTTQERPAPSTAAAASPAEEWGSVFISYRHEDRGVADDLFTLLGERRVSAWYDPLIPHGTDWREAIVAQLGKARVMVILLSAGESESEEPGPPRARCFARSSIFDRSPAAGSCRGPTSPSLCCSMPRAAAIHVLPSLASRRGEVEAVLAAAFASGDEQIRAAVAEAWAATGQAPGEWVARVFADPSPEVRQRGFLLLARLSPGDPRRLSFTAAAAQDESRSVRDEALRFAAELGEPGAALFARYAASGGDLTERFFDRADRLDTVGDALAKALDARAENASSWELERIVELLGRTGAAAPEVRRRLHAELESGDPAARDSAARGLSTLREDPWAHDGRLATALMDLGARRVAEEKLDAALEGSINAAPRFPRTSGLLHPPAVPGQGGPGARLLL